ncbi:MAG: DUF1146 domain-containing protein [Erysipelothrix sp.]|nr:DUF1146 domain-containing protein [Erysipelothrix sp.]
MSDYLRVGIHVLSFVFCAYVLLHVDFIKFMRKGHESKAQILYIIVALGLSYLVAQFFMNMSINFVY